METIFISSVLERRETLIESKSGLIAKLRVISQMAQFQGTHVVFSALRKYKPVAILS